MRQKPCTRRTLFFLIAALAITALANITITAQNDRQAEAALQRALNKEFIDGDIEGAIKEYKDVVSRYGGSRGIATKALLRLGQAYERLDNEEAQKAYKRVVSDYSDQREAVAEAQARLKAFPNVSSAPTFAPRELTRICSKGCSWDAVTPDGRYLVGFAELRDLITGEARGIGGSYRENTTFTADGKQMAYATIQGGELEMHVSAFNPLEETKGRVLLRNEEFPYNVPFGWSTDNKEVFALLERKDESTLIAAISTSNSSIRVIKSLEWRWPEKISLSQDGRYIAYDAPVTRESRNRDIYVLAADGSGETPLVQSPSFDSVPVWTPDGKAVVYKSDQNGTLALWKIQVADGKPQGTPELLRRLEKDITPLGFARNGLYYYGTSRTSDSDVFTADIDLESGKVLRPASRAIETFSGRNSAPAYSPDGKQLAYFSERSISGGFLSIIIRSMESGAEKEIPTSFTGTPRGVAWFPDGQSLGFATNYFFHRVDIKSGEDLIKERISVGGVPSVSPDGKKLYYINRGTGRAATLLAYDFESRTEKDLFHGEVPQPGSLPLRIAISPDGKQIATTLTEKSAPTLTNPNGTANTQPVVVRLLSIDGGPPRTLRSPSSPRLTVLEWSRDGMGLLVQRGNGQLWWVPADGGVSRQIGTEPFPTVQSLRPDGKQIAYTQTGAPQQRETWVDPDLLRPNPQTSTGGIYVAQFDPVTGRVRGPVTLLDGADSGCAPSFSHDGKSIGFKRPGPENANGRRPLVWVVRSLATGDEKILTNNPTPCWVAPVWAHDNKSFLNGSFLEANGPLVRFDLSTLRGSQLRIPHYKPAIALSQDDRTLYLTAHNEKEKKTSIVSVDLASGEEKQVWVSPSAVDTTILVPLRLAISPDGRTLALILSEGEKSQLIRVGVDGSGYRRLYSAEGAGGGAALSRSGLAWTKDGRSILFMDADKTGQRLLRISADGGKPEFTGLVIGDIDAVFDLSPDGRTLAFHSPGVPTISTTTTR